MSVHVYIYIEDNDFCLVNLKVQTKICDCLRRAPVTVLLTRILMINLFQQKDKYSFVEIYKCSDFF